MHTSKTLKRLLAVSAVAAMFSTVGVQAQTTSAAQTQTAGKAQPDARLSSGDEKALKDMAQANINEVAAARLALDKAQTSEVKTFAQKKGVELPTEPDAAHKALNSRLENQRGDAFDNMYMEYAGVKDHEKVLSKLKSDASKIDDPDVKALANEHTPVVEQHLKSAEQMSTRAGASADK